MSRNLFKISLVLFFLNYGNTTCFFSREVQGIYVTQNTITNSELQYNYINITEDSIPLWGHCHRRIKSNVILISAYDDTNCYRCFNLHLYSRNILHVTTDKDYISKCYTNEATALRLCPLGIRKIDAKKHTEMFLYKTNEYNGDQIKIENCPINGRYTLTYNGEDNNNDSRIECPTPESELDSCPIGSSLRVHFRNCIFNYTDITYECLGHWKGTNNFKYLALKLKQTDDHDDVKSQYKCAIYEEQKNQIIKITISDSTCDWSSHKVRKLNGKYYRETLTLFPVEKFLWPSIEFYNFPNWMFGKWENLEILNDTLIFENLLSFKTYTMKLLDDKNNENDRYLVYVRSQCGEEFYTCVSIKKRTENILEFQMGIQPSKFSSSNLCNEDNFGDDLWLTQSRLDNVHGTALCPVIGNFNGILPDENDFCAKLTSNCKSLDIMYYQIHLCKNDEIIYADRTYRCLGQWQENGNIYTYTRREDVIKYECFVGTMNSKNSLYIKEAGENCERNIPEIGMELIKTNDCDNINQLNTNPTLNNEINLISTTTEFITENIENFTLKSLLKSTAKTNTLNLSDDSKSNKKSCTDSLIFKNYFKILLIIITVLYIL